jgi:hypothetical protein
VEIELTDDPDGRIARVARAAAGDAGLGLAVTRGDRQSVSAWWRAGVDDALERAPDGAVRVRYRAARSPRSTRGATRA